MAAQPLRAGRDARRTRAARRLERRGQPIRPSSSASGARRSPWPIVAVHMSLTSTGEVFALDGFGAGAQLRAASGTRRRALFRVGSVRAQPLLLGHVQLPDGRTLLVGGHINAYRGARRHDALQRADEHVLPRRRTWPSRAGIRPRPSSATAASSSSPATGSSRTGPAQLAALLGRLRQLAPGALQPEHEHVDEPDERAADDAALSAAVRPLGRPDRRRRPGHDDARPDARAVDVVDRWRRARSTGTAPSCTGRTRS